MTIDKFDPNLVLVNINKLKPYRFVEDQTPQLVLAIYLMISYQKNQLRKTILIICPLRNWLNFI
jgi:hypothetical protein